MKSFDELTKDLKDARNRIERWRSESFTVNGPREVPERIPWALKLNLSSAEKRLLAHPDSFARVRCWMVDIEGVKGTKLTEEQMMKAVAQYVEGDADASDNAGNLCRRVRKWLQAENWDVTDSGMGRDSWHLGAHCTTYEAMRLCQEAPKKFDVLFERGVLRMARMPWSLAVIVKG